MGSVSNDICAENGAMNESSGGNMCGKKKIEWLSVLQGFSMLLVVIGHVSLTNIPRDPNTPIASELERIIYSFHMPLFIFISGWLFYFTCIRKEKTYADVIKAKIKRLGLPFLAFTMLALALKLVFPSLMNRPVTTQELIDTFLFFRSNPLGEMWFIVVLLVLMMLYPLYCYVVKSKWLVAFVAWAFSIIVCVCPTSLTYFQLNRVCHMAPFFVAGILCCRYGWHKWLENFRTLGISFFMFLLWNIMRLMFDPMGLFSVTAGIVFSFSLCLNLAKRWPSLFRSFRDYTFQIFLMGIFFQMVVRWVYVRMGCDWMFVPFWLLSVVIGVFVPVAIAKLVEKKAPKFIRLCMGL